MMIKVVILFLMVVAHGIRAEEFFIPDNRLEIDIFHGETLFSIAGQKLKSGEEAAALISYICRNWTLKERPVLVVESHTKAFMPGQEFLYAAITEVSKKWKLRVVHMPEPSGIASVGEVEASRLVREWKARK